MLQYRFGSRYMIRSEEHTSELQSQSNLVCRLLLEKKKIDDDHVGLRRLPPCRKKETLVEALALEPLAQVRLRRHLVPDLVTGLHGQVAQRAAFRRTCPLDQVCEFLLAFTRKQCGVLFFFNDTATTEIYTLSLHDALPI